MDKLRKLQLIQLHILKDIDKLCKEHNLKYYLIGGTLLGAIRHQGFIPWDDDVDIVMYRNDLYRLEKVVSEKYKDKYFVQNFKTDKFYTRYITKIRLNNTSQIEKGLENVRSHNGIYIDIFPLDKIHIDKGLSLIIRGKILRLLFAYKTIRFSKDKNTTKVKQFLIKMFKPFSFLMPDKLLNKSFDKICTLSEGKDCKYTTNFGSCYGWEKQVVENSVYGEGVLMQFEDFFFNVPDKFEVILTNLYGDYMKLPPIEKRKSGHILTEINLGEYGSLIE